VREPPVLETPCDPAPTAGRVLSRLAIRVALMALVLAAIFCVYLSSPIVVRESGLPSKGRKVQAGRDLRSIITVAEAIHEDTGRYPESIEAMVGFRNEDGSPGIAALEKSPKDPWGHPYLYEVPAEGCAKATCLGNDGQPGGEGEAADTVVYREGG
jgi:general secretion pathway protein G